MAQSHCKSSPSSFDERRVAANTQTKQTDLSHESADNWQLPSMSTIAIHY